MKFKFLTLGMVATLSSSLNAFDYKIKDGLQLLGAVVDITDFTPFKNKCVNFFHYTDYQNDTHFIYNPNGNTQNNTLTILKKGQGFFLSASGDCTISIDEGSENNANSGNIVHNGINYKEIQSPTTSKIWLDRNLGASQVCDKKRTDFSSDLEYENSQKDCFGYYYQWGRGNDGHQIPHSMNTHNLLDFNSQSNKFVITDDHHTFYDWVKMDENGQKRRSKLNSLDGSFICPVGFRVPSINDLEKEAANMANFINILKFPLNGMKSRYYEDYIYAQGDMGRLWTRDTSEEPGSKYSMDFLYDEISSNTGVWKDRARGGGIRCIKD